MNERSAREQFTLAADLFRENEAMFGDIKQDKEKANFYRGLALMAEGLSRLVEEQNETKKQNNAYRHPASIRPG
jgi:hypothetical protein